MSNLSTNYVASSTTANTFKKQDNQAEATGFDALMDIEDIKAGRFNIADQLLATIAKTTGRAVNSASQAPGTFPFSDEFKSVFGDSGPLFDYINMLTSKLGLTAEKNQALQDICIRNKDITYTKANVDKIAAELKQAGIG